ncbi:MobH family relaxase [Achromobacter aloeverae]
MSKRHDATPPAAVGQLPIPTRARPPSPRHLPVLSAHALIARMDLDGYIARIKQRLGFTPESYDRDVAPLLSSFADFVQLLPASESHHHAQPGGLLIHLLEVGSHALHFRDAYKLPKGSGPEEQMRLAARYSYAVLVAALLHDVGKPVADIEVNLMRQDGSESPWVPLGGTMAQQGGVWYSVGFPTTRQYHKHEKMALPLLRSIVPAPALAWLGEHRPLMEELVQYLGADGQSTILAEIVSKADRKSVADNLLHGPRTRFSSAKSVPLIERLMVALRRLLVESHLVLNRAGAAGYCDGQHLWFVSGTVADAVRDYLNRNEQRQENAPGVPEDNSRLFDTWQEYGAIETNASGSAIWRVQVTIGPWAQTLTMLKFPLDKLYAEQAQYPKALPPGAIEAVVVSSPQNKGHLVDQVDPNLPVVQPLPLSEPTPTSEAVFGQNTQAVTDSIELAQPEPTDLPNGSELGLASDFDMHGPDPADLGESLGADIVSEGSRPVALDAPAVAGADDGFLDDTDAAATLDATPNRPAPPDLMTGPVSPATKLDSELAAKAIDTPRKGNVERFMAWIQSGIANGTLAYNEANAAVHFCPEGMLLVSPRIFRHYAEQFEARIDLAIDGATKEPWRVLQQQFQKSGYPVKAPKATGGSFLHRYNVAGPGGKQLIGNIVPHPQRFFDPVPPVNALLKPATVPGLAGAGDRDEITKSGPGVR